MIFISCNIQTKRTIKKTIYKTRVVSHGPGSKFSNGQFVLVVHIGKIISQAVFVKQSFPFIGIYDAI